MTSSTVETLGIGNVLSPELQKKNHKSSISQTIRQKFHSVQLTSNRSSLSIGCTVSDNCNHKKKEN